MYRIAPSGLPCLVSELILVNNKYDEDKDVTYLYPHTFVCIVQFRPSNVAIGQEVFVPFDGELSA